MDRRSPKIPRIGYAALACLVAALYGRHLDVGYLADDFVFLEWAQHGVWELLSRVSGGTEPRFLRPLPALLWYLGPSPYGAQIHHALSLVAHFLCGVMITRLAGRLSRSPEVRLLAGGLFLAFPLFTEPVLWLSSGPDLWACLFALAALEVGLAGNASASSLAGASVLFAAGLLSKESIMMLPLVPLLLFPGRHAKKLYLMLCLVALAYLGSRFALLGGLGGYPDALERSLMERFDPVFFLRNICLQLPYRVLIPLKRAAELELPLAAISILLIGGLALSTRFQIRSMRLVCALAATLAAILPAAPWLSIDVDHEGSRMVYFAVAVLAIGAVGCCGKPRKSLRLAAPLLLAFWGTVSAVNARAWHDAGLEVTRTVNLMREIEPRYLSGTTILIAGHDVRRGAYVWRNGLAYASRLNGLRHDLHWRFGTVATLEDHAALGQTVFEVGPNVGEHGADFTTCQIDLREHALQALATYEPPQGAEDPATPLRVLQTPVMHLAAPTSSPAVRLHFAGCNLALESTGRLYWRTSDRLPFSVTEARRFVLKPTESTSDVIIRLEPTTEPLDTLELRLDTDQHRTSCVKAIEVLGGPASCMGIPFQPASNPSR